MCYEVSYVVWKHRVETAMWLGFSFIDKFVHIPTAVWTLSCASNSQPFLAGKTKLVVTLRIVNEFLSKYYPTEGNLLFISIDKKQKFIWPLSAEPRVWRKVACLQQTTLGRLRVFWNLCRAKSWWFTNFRKVENEGANSKWYSFVSLHQIDLKLPNYIVYHLLNFCITMLFCCNDVYFWVHCGN